MSNASDHARRWRNPLAVRNAAAERVAESLLLGSRLRRRTTAGWALGTFLIELPNPATLTTLALAGFDFVVLDMEHSATDFTTLQPLITAAQAAGLVALVRPWAEDTGLIGKILDMGAHGIMAPHVDSVERAQQIVAQARFPPRGQRGFAPLTKFDALSHPLQQLDESTYVVLQIEGRAALDQAASIAAVPGIDALFVGPFDLALSMGVTPGSAAVYSAAERVAREIPDGVALGLYVDDPAKCPQWAARRFSLQCVSFDGRMLASGAREIVGQARRAMAARRKKKK